MGVRPDDLYGLPLDEFTTARDELAKDLRRRGRKEAAEEVKALRKPSVSAWAVNQAARRRPEDVKRLVKAGSELRKAQRGVVGGGDPAALRTATGAHRALVEELTDTARELLAERGAVSQAVVTRVAQTLRGASVDKDAAKALQAGTLVEDVEQSGFGPLLSAVPSTPRQRRRPEARPQPRRAAAPKPKPPPKPRPDPNAAKRRRLEQQLDAARAKVRELEARLEALGPVPGERG
ncbi:MAG TPA: hypothetical protein VHH55_03660 [Gaiellaceae bacterium]|nr:hypothetical protein [Gaiellaceae bacterium]